MRLAFRSGGEALQPGTVRLPCQVPVTESVVASGNPITADFTYVRFLGDRKSIEEQTKVWDKVIVDRRAELSEWVEILGKRPQTENTNLRLREQSFCRIWSGDCRDVSRPLAEAGEGRDEEWKSWGLVAYVTATAPTLPDSLELIREKRRQLNGRCGAEGCRGNNRAVR